jgi:hypothetical protein
MLDISNKHEVSFNRIDSGMLIEKCASKINFPLKFRCAVRRQNRLADFNMACLIARNCNTCGTLGPMPFSTARKKISSAWDEVVVSEELCRRTSGRRKVYILILVRSCGRRTRCARRRRVLEVAFVGWFQTQGETASQCRRSWAS